MTFITAVSARAQTQQDMIISPQTFAKKKIAGIEKKVYVPYPKCLLHTTTIFIFEYIYHIYF